MLNLIKCLSGEQPLPEEQLLPLVKWVIEDKSNDNNKMLNDFFQKLIRTDNYPQIIKLLLLRDSRATVDPSANDNYAIRLASQNGHVETVKLLLEDNRVDPSANNNYSIKEASRNGHMEIVKLLIPRINISKITDEKILSIAKEIKEKVTDAKTEINTSSSEVKEKVTDANTEINTSDNNGKSVDSIVNCIIGMAKEYKISKITLEFEL